MRGGALELARFCERRCRGRYPPRQRERARVPRVGHAGPEPSPTRARARYRPAIERAATCFTAALTSSSRGTREPAQGEGLEFAYKPTRRRR